MAQQFILKHSNVQRYVAWRYTIKRVPKGQKRTCKIEWYSHALHLWYVEMSFATLAIARKHWNEKIGFGYARTK